MSNRGDLVDMQKKAEEEIEFIKAQYQANKEKVIKLLIENIINVDLEIPSVVKGVFE